jgi:rubrerythrin
MTPTADFDLDRYLRASAKVDLTGIAWERIGEHPLSPAEVRTLTYMMDIESHTVVYLRDLLATRAAFQPDVTAFLSCWVYEELWHGEAISRFLGEAGHPVGSDGDLPTIDAPLPSRLERNTWIRRSLGRGATLAHLGTMAGSRLLGEDFIAVHMTWGAVNELSTLNGYQRLIATTEHPVLVELLKRIIKDERRHFAFYRAQARMRLADSRRARTVTRWAMDHLWAPVGTGVRPQSETDFAIGYLFDGPDGAAAIEDMDATVRELPGFADAHLFRDAQAEALARRGGVGVGARQAEHERVLAA